MSTHAIMDASRSVTRNAIYAFSAIMVQLWRYQQCVECVECDICVECVERV